MRCSSAVRRRCGSRVIHRDGQASTPDACPHPLWQDRTNLATGLRLFRFLERPCPTQPGRSSLSRSRPSPPTERAAQRNGLCSSGRNTARYLTLARILISSGARSSRGEVDLVGRRSGAANRLRDLLLWLDVVVGRELLPPRHVRVDHLREVLLARGEWNTAHRRESLLRLGLGHHFRDRPVQTVDHRLRGLGRREVPARPPRRPGGPAR